MKKEERIRLGKTIAQGEQRLLSEADSTNYLLFMHSCKLIPDYKEWKIVVSADLIYHLLDRIEELEAKCK
jgi:hypothetical protein